MLQLKLHIIHVNVYLINYLYLYIMLIGNVNQLYIKSVIIYKYSFQY